MKKVFKTMAFTLLGLVLSVNLMAADTWVKLTSAPAVGDVVVLVYESGDTHKEMTGISSTSTVYGIASNFSNSPNGTYELTVCAGNSTGSLAFKNGDDYLNYSGSKNTLTKNSTLSNNTSWTVSVSSGDFTITNVGSNTRVIKYNTTSGQERFACYTTGQQLIQMYKKQSSTPSELAAPSIMTQPEGATYEKDATATALTIAASGNPAPTYQWYSNTTESTSGASEITGATEVSYTPSTTTVGTKYYYCVASNSEGSATSDIVAVTITAALPKIVITKTSSGIKGSYADETFTLNDVTFAYTQWCYSTDFIQAKASQSPSLKNTTAMPGKITKIQVVTGSGKTARAVTVKAGTTNEIDKMVSITSPTTSMDMVFDFGETNYTYFCLSTPGNACYFDKIVIFYEELAPTNEAVTFTAPEGGSLVIKNGATPIATGATIQDGTVLDVEFGMTPAEAYKDVAIKVTKTEGGDDVTSTVYNSETQKITMPRYPITVAVTFTKLYKISLVKAGEGEGTATMNGVTTDIYVDDDTQIDLVASAVAPNEFTKWSATDNISIDAENDAETYAHAIGDGTITATFGVSALLPLDAPTLSAPTNITYNSVTLNWQELANAEGGYNVEIWLNDVMVVYESGIGETSWTPDFTFQANTTYTYTVQGVGDGSTYAEENNPKATSTFTTADYPAATLTLSENGVETPVNGKLNTPIELPTTSTQACEGKVFMGWSATEIDGETDVEPSLLGETYTFTDPEQLTKTIYAVYAKKVEGDKYFEKVSSAPADWCGKYLIVYETGNLAMDGSLTTLDAVSNTKAVTISNSKIAWSQDMDDISFTIAYKTGSSTVYSLKSASGKYISGTTTSAKASNGMKQADTDVDYEISFDGIELQSKSSDQQMALKYNKANDQTRFRFYKSGQEAIALYKYSATLSYSNYCTTCQAAVAAPTFSLAEGNYGEAKTLELTATEGAIYYTINGGTETLYEEEIVLDKRGTYEISAYAKVDDRTSETVTKTYTLDWPYTSLAELAAADIPSGTVVTISFENAVIKSLASKGVYFDVQKEGKDIEIYCNSTAIPENWKVGGTLSVTNLTCAWVRYPATGNLTCWELTPSNWNSFTYNDPVHITSIAISGEPTNKDYSDGQTLNPAGLVVTGFYSDHTEQVSHTEVITEGLTWTLPTLEEGATTAQVSVKYTEPVLSNELTSDPYQVTINAVTPAKTLESIYVADDSEHKTAFFVGRPFSSDGLKVMAKYNIGEDQAIIPTSVTPPAMTSAGTKQVTVSYTEGGVTADAVTYDITLTYMNLSDLVAATDIEKDDYVYVSFENVKINGFYTNSSGKRYGIYLDVQKSSKDIEIYCNSAEHDATWKQYGTVSATFDNVKWTEYNGTWELTPSSWENVTYTAPNIPVTSMEISPAEVSVGEAKTTTLSIVYTPNNATNIGVTWAVTAGSEYASVDEEGVVTGILAGSATITATLTADPSITATRTVTVTETEKCEISYYVKGEVASTQQIAREEEGALTYVPTLEVAGYTFAGWAEDAIAEETATATLISTYTPGAEETAKSVYAVFKRVDDSSPTYQQYAKVTSALTDWAGDYLIAYSDEIFADGRIGGKEDEGAIGKQYVKVNPEGALSGNVVTKEWGDQYKVTLEEISAGSNTYVLKTQDGKYNYQTGNSNGLSASSTKSTAAQYPITVTFTSENDIKLALGGNAAGAVFRYNTDQFFRYYKDGGQQPVYLYKYDAGSVMYTSNPVAKVKVTFNLDGGVGGCGTITVNEGEDAVLCGDAPTKDLYKFDAWSDGENEYAPGATITHVTEDIELTALWIAKQQYTISFNKAGAAGTTPNAITDYEYNEVTLPVQGDLSNPGYIFGGWNDGETTHAGGATFTMPEKNVSMTAVWVAKTNDKWVLVTEASQLKAGEKYVIANNENDVVAGDITGSNVYMNKVDATFSDNKQFITAMAGQVELTLGGSTDAWTFAKDASNYLANSNTSLSWNTTASTWKIAFEDDKMTIVEGENKSLQYNTSSPRFKTYTSSQAAVQLYRLIPAQAIEEEVDASTLPEQADVTVNEGGNLLIDAPKTLGDIYVMEGGKVTISGSATLTVNNFVIKSTMGAGQSGQVIGVTSTNLTITGSAYYDVVLGDNGNPDKWHAFAVPFNVDAINGVYDLNDNKLTNEVNYAIMDYHGDVRAEGKYGWKKFRGIMQPGVFYLMTVDGERTTYRMKMNGGFQASSTTITVNEYASGTTTDAGWNGIANNQLGYSSLGVDVQVLNPTSYTYETMTASTYNFTVGTPFFYQADATGTIDLTAPNASENYAPRRVGAAEAKNIAVTLGNDNYTDRLYISATDEATNEYQIGRDLVKMTMTNAPAVPQIFAEAYGTKLSMIDVPMMNDEAVYALNLYAPANGEYTIGAAQVDGYEVFLTQYGSVIWNLSMSEAIIELTKGNNTEYGLILKATSGHAPTDINTLNGQESVQKFLYNSNIYIRHNNKTFNVQGQLVK